MSEDNRHTQVSWFNELTKLFRKTPKIIFRERSNNFQYVLNKIFSSSRGNPVSLKLMLSVLPRSACKPYSAPGSDSSESAYISLDKSPGAD